MSNQENKLPKAEEELMDAENTLFRHVSKVYNLSDVIDAMEEHTRLHTASLREELEKLRADKESLLVRVEEVREINKQLEHEMLLVKRNNKDLKAENERLKKDISDYSSQVCDLQDEQENLSDENYGIMVENQKLREALEKIRRWDDELEEEYGDPGELAKEALKV